MVQLVDLVNILSEAVFAIGQNGRIVAWSAGAQELLGYTEDTVIGERCSNILQGTYQSGEPLCTASCEGYSCFICGTNFSADSCLLRHKAGQLIPASISSISVLPEQRNHYSGDAVAIIFMQKSSLEYEKEVCYQSLRIFTLGHFSLVIEGKGLAVDTWKRRTALTVLKCLVTDVDHPVHRERLIEYIWPDVDPERGWARLKVAISFLRKQLMDSGMPTDPVATVGQSYILHSKAVWIDAKEFEKQVAAGHAMERQKRFDEALICFEDAKRLYSGDYLEDDPYADWCAGERERLRELYFEMLAGMAKCKAAAGDYVGAAQACREALYRDQCRESFLHTLIDYLGRIDRADWAKPQLAIWQRVFTEEFDMVPKPEHLRVYQELIEAKVRPVKSESGPKISRK